LGIYQSSGFLWDWRCREPANAENRDPNLNYGGAPLVRGRDRGKLYWRDTQEDPHGCGGGEERAGARNPAPEFAAALHQP
jgi:hypothetical protein